MTNEEKRQEILTELVTDPRYKVICEKYTIGNDYYTEELFQEVCLILAKFDTDKLISVYKSKGKKDGKPGLKNYFTGIVINQAISTGSTFYKTFKKYDSKKINDCWNDNVLPIDKEDKEESKKIIEIFERNEKLLNKIKQFLIEYEKENPKFNWYYFKLYFFDDITYKEIVKKTGKKYGLIYQSVCRVLKLIKKKFKLEQWN